MTRIASYLLSSIIASLPVLAIGQGHVLTSKMTKFELVEVGQLATMELMGSFPVTHVGATHNRAVIASQPAGRIVSFSIVEDHADSFALSGPELVRLQLERVPGAMVVMNDSVLAWDARSSSLISFDLDGTILSTWSGLTEEVARMTVANRHVFMMLRSSYRAHAIIEYSLDESRVVEAHGLRNPAHDVRMGMWGSGGLVGWGDSLVFALAGDAAVSLVRVGANNSMPARPRGQLHGATDCAGGSGKGGGTVGLEWLDRVRGLHRLNGYFLLVQEVVIDCDRHMIIRVLDDQLNEVDQFSLSSDQRTEFGYDFVGLIGETIVLYYHSVGHPADNLLHFWQLRVS